MAEIESFELAPVFQAIQDAMQQSCMEFNQADSTNGNHGDHMVAIFGVAVQAAREKQAAGLAEAMDYAGRLLLDLPDNASAQVYARGLAELGGQFRKYQLTQEDLVLYLHKVLQEDAPQPASPYAPRPGTTQTNPTATDVSPRSGDVLKALVSALAGWQQAETGKPKPANPLDLGYMFDLGIAYLQARQRNSTRAEVIADAAATVSPLGQVPHRYKSGKVVILTLLQALANPGFSVT
jgi:hypothetical protein